MTGTGRLGLPMTRRAGLRLAALVGGAGSAGVLAAACGQSAAGTPEYKPGAQPVTISFSHWGTESGLGQMNREAARQFTAQYPNVKVDLIFKPDDYLTQLQTMFAGGSAPDVFDISTPDFPAWAKNDTMREADAYVKRDQGKGFDWNDLWSRHRDAGKYKGKTYGVLARISPYVLYYNPSMFQRAGIKVPDQTWGLAEFTDAARKLTSPAGANGNSDVYGYALVNRHHWIWRNGADYLSAKDDKWKPTINTPAFVEAIQNLIDLRQKYRVIGSAAELGNPGGTLPNYGSWITNQQIAMHDALVARVPDYRSDPKMTFDRFDVAHLPKLNGARQTDMDRVVRPISKPSKNPEEGWLWIKFLLQKPAITAVSMPAVMSWVKSNEFLRPDLPPRNMKVFLEVVEYARTVPEHPRWSDLNRLIAKQLDDAYAGKQSAKQACEQADRDVASQLQQWGELA